MDKYLPYADKNDFFLLDHYSVNIPFNPIRHVHELDSNCDFRYVNIAIAVSFQFHFNCFEYFRELVDYSPWAGC